MLISDFNVRKINMNYCSCSDLAEFNVCVMSKLKCASLHANVHLHALTKCS